VEITVTVVVVVTLVMVAVEPSVSDAMVIELRLALPNCRIIVAPEREERLRIAAESWRGLLNGLLGLTEVAPEPGPF